MSVEKKIKYSIGIGIVTISLFLIGYTINSGKLFTGNTPPDEISAPEVSVPPPPANYYADHGIVDHSLLVSKGVIEPNQNLAEILLKHNVSYPEIEALATKSKDVFYVRKIAPGKNYYIFSGDDSLKKAKVFIYEPDAVNYIVYKIGENSEIYKGEKETETRTETASGVISSSLWQTMTDNHLDPNLPIALSEIFAWEIDFYRILKGDRFKVLYEENFVEGKSVGIAKIIAAYFMHGGDDFYALYFEQDGIGDYFDLDARSLRKAFLKSPLKFSRITSSYSMHRFHPVQKRFKPHLGVDYAAPKGTPILATGDGIVSEAGYTGGNGNYVKIRHNSIYSTQYLHMTGFRKGIRKGTRVRQGNIIGYVGSTGLATGPHVCYRFWKNGSQVNPLTVKIPPSDPVKPKYLEEYKLLKEKLTGKLDSLYQGPV